MAMCWAFATTTGKSYSWSSAATAPCRYGPNPSPSFGSRSSSTYGPILTSLPTSRPTRYYEWYLYHAYILYGAFAISDQWAATFKEFPPMQRPNTFTIDDALRTMQEAAGGGGH